MRPHGPTAPSETILPDALLVHRVAALSDKSALAELDARHGLTLYAIAYSFLFDGEAADLAVAAALREVWRSAASFDAARGSVGRWLAALTRRAACAQLEGRAA
jgi:RNA polymerase sigma-70 factor, ECF subfamily